MDDLRTQVASIRADPSGSVLSFDFDGTLSPIVGDPAAARLGPGLASLLEELAQAYRRVAVLSGRPVAFLVEQIPGSVDLSGLYGLEARIGGVVTEHPEAPRWRPVVADAAALARDAACSGGPLDGLNVEEKGLSLTLHVRTRPDLATAVEEFAGALAGCTGLELRSAKMSVELHPPIHVDKGSALRSLAEDASAVLYVGDDVGDLPAFEALADLADPLRSPAGKVAVGVAVGGLELPAEVRRRADLVLPDQVAVADLLEALLP